MPLLKATSVDIGLGRPLTASAVSPPYLDDYGHGGVAPPRSNVPSWYRGLHQSLRTLSQSRLNLDELDDDVVVDDNDDYDAEMFGRNIAN